MSKVHTDRKVHDEIGIGHNRPDPTPGLLAQLAADHGNFRDRISEFEQQIGDLPMTVESKADHDLHVDIIAKLRVLDKHVEATRVAEKEPHLRAERAVDGFFQPLRQDCARLISGLAYEVKRWLDAKAEAERQERFAEARRQAEEASKLRAAEEALRARAEAAQREATRERNARLAEEQAAAAAEAEQNALTTLRAAQVKPAELARTRSDQGSLSTLKSVWLCEVENYDALDMEALRPYIATEALDDAVKAFVKIGGREMPGARIWQGTKLSVRG